MLVICLGDCSRGLFAVSAIVAGAVTFIAVSDASPVDPFSGNIPWILGSKHDPDRRACGHVDRALSQRSQIRATNQEMISSPRRFVRLFSLSAVLPALVVGVLLGATVTRGIQTWFSDRVDVIVDRNAAIAQGNFFNFTEDLQADAGWIATEYLEASGNLGSRVELIEEFLRTQAFIRNFQEAAIINREGERIAAATLLDRLSKRTPDAGAFCRSRCRRRRPHTLSKVACNNRSHPT